MGLFYPSSENFLMIHMKNVWKSNPNVSNSNFGMGYIWWHYLLYDPFKGLAHINKVKEVLIHISFDIVYRYQELA